jgi:hypothetical protein
MSATILMVASKFDEIDYNLVKVNRLAVHFPSYHSNDFVFAEKKLLQFFEWDLKITTPLHYLNTYQTCGIALEGEDRNGLINEVFRLYHQISSSISYLEIRNIHKASVVASAILK